MPVSKLISSVFYCFMNFSCISLFFLLFVFLVFFGEICGRHFLKHNNAKTNSFQPLRVKISIFIWTMWKKLNLHWFCTQNQILEPFSVRRACTKSYVTSEPYPRASQIWCQNVRETWKKKVIKCRGESFARCRVIARNVEGGPFRPPPPVLLGLSVSRLCAELTPFWCSTDEGYCFK